MKNSIKQGLTASVLAIGLQGIVMAQKSGELPVTTSCDSVEVTKNNITTRVAECFVKSGEQVTYLREGESIRIGLHTYTRSEDRIVRKYVGNDKEATDKAIANVKSCIALAESEGAKLGFSGETIFNNKLACLKK